MAITKKRKKQADGQHVLDVVERWKPRLFMAHYDIKVVFHDDAPHDDRRPNESLDSCAYIEPKYANRYHAATIHVYPAFFEETRLIRERLLVHELAHIPLEIVSELVDRLRDGKTVSDEEHENAVERATDWFARALLAATEAR